MKPSIGRIVHFVQNGVHYPAMIVKVWTDTCVNLLVFQNGSDKIAPGAVDTNSIAHSVCERPMSTPCRRAGDAVTIEWSWSWHWPEIVEL